MWALSKGPPALRRLSRQERVETSPLRGDHGPTTLHGVGDATSSLLVSIPCGPTRTHITDAVRANPPVSVCPSRMTFARRSRCSVKGLAGITRRSSGAPGPCQMRVAIWRSNKIFGSPRSWPVRRRAQCSRKRTVLR
jgi:hypothetical protein